jgi:hypothetical protein
MAEAKGEGGGWMFGREEIFEKKWSRELITLNLQCAWNEWGKVASERRRWKVFVGLTHFLGDLPAFTLEQRARDIQRAAN